MIMGSKWSSERWMMKQKGCALQLVRHETKGRTLRVGIDLHSQCVRYMNKGAHSWGGSGMSLRFVTALVQENLRTAPFPMQHAYGGSSLSLWMRSKIYWCTVNHFSTNAAALSYSCIHVKKLLHPPSVSLACHLQLLLPRHVFLLSWSSHSKP